MKLENKFKIRLIKQLYGHTHLTVADLSKKIKKSIPFTTALISELIEDGILVENGLALSNGGRRPQMYSFKENAHFLLAVSVNQLSTRVSFFNLKGERYGQVWEKDNVLDTTGKDLELLGKIIENFIQKSQVDRERIIGIGVGMPGFIKCQKGINHNFLKHSDLSITEYLESITNLPVFIDNDSSLLALAELKNGLAKDRSNALVVNITWGVGLGAIVSGEVLRGENGYAGEFSHIALYDNKKICSCGKFGCLETETSLYVLIDKAKDGIKNNEYTILPKLLPENKTEAIKLIFDAINKGDIFSLGLIKQLGQNLGRGISILIHLFNPGIVILSGLGSEVGRVWLAPVQQTINELSIPKLAENTELKVSTLGQDADLIGAAALVMENLEKVANFDFTEV